MFYKLETNRFYLLRFAVTRARYFESKLQITIEVLIQSDQLDIFPTTDST